MTGSHSRQRAYAWNLKRTYIDANPMKFALIARYFRFHTCTDSGCFFKVGMRVDVIKFRQL